MYNSLIKTIKSKKKLGLIDYKWEIRLQLSKKYPKNIDVKNILFADAVSSIIYLTRNRKKILQDKSLLAVCNLCTDVNAISNVEHKDKVLQHYANLFNQLFNSARNVHLCYDCGTVARGVFYELISMYRGSFNVSDREIKQVRDEYRMNKYNGTDGVVKLKEKVYSINQNSIFLCALQFGENFGHIYVLEKIYINNKPRFRIYQSCFNAFLLIDYIECMDYCRDLSTGVVIDEHIEALNMLLSTPEWNKKHIELFIFWFKFYPEYGLHKDEKKLFTFTSIIL